MEYYSGNKDLNIYPFSFSDNSCVRFTDKSQNGCERNVISNYWREQLNLYGSKVDYYVNNFSLLSADNLYGEHPTQKFSSPASIVIGLTLNENALMLSKYGLMSDDEITALVHISAFCVVFGDTAEPKAGDVFRLTEYGSDRHNNRAGNFYEITQRMDQDINQINFLAGHYVWLLKAKRFEYSFEPGLSGGETVNDQIFDDTVTAGVSGANKTYSYDADTSGKQVFDYTASTNFDNVYGGY